MIIALLVVFVSVKNASPESAPHLCDVGDMVQNEHVYCVCARDYYKCQPKKYVDLIDNFEEGDNKIHSCEPNKIYIDNTTTCICNKNGTWPHAACEDSFKSLPITSVVKNYCQPDSYVIVDCNLCRCNSKGIIDRNRCTKNECEDISKRGSIISKYVYGSCKAKLWYCISPCQFCFCIDDNKLVCNTKKFNTVSLGSFNISVCGNDLIRDAIKLIPAEKILQDMEVPIHTQINRENLSKIDVKFSTERINTQIVKEIDRLHESYTKNKTYKDNSNNQTEIGNEHKETVKSELKVYNLPLRKKSSLTIDKKSECTPGVNKKVACNTCFCLNNHKMLCTNKKCE